MGLTCPRLAGLAREGDGPRNDGNEMSDWSAQTQQARTWFESLRDSICAEFEAIEREAGSDASFAYTPWDREEEGNDNPGGGVQGLMKGKVFEKVGVNVSTVHGTFAPEFAKTINGAEDDGGAEGQFMHPAARAACAKHNPTYYERFSKWAEEYFYIPHRGVHRGVGGIFYDHLECADEAAFARNLAFTQDVGRFHRHGQAHPARMARALRRVQSRLRPGHAVRPEDRRECRCHPDEPAPAGRVGLTGGIFRALEFAQNTQN